MGAIEEDDSEAEAANLRWVVEQGKRSGRVVDVTTAALFESLDDAADFADVEPGTLATVLDTRPQAVVIEGVVKHDDNRGDVNYTLASAKGSSEAVVQQIVMLEPTGASESFEWRVDVPQDGDLAALLRREIIQQTEEALRASDDAPDWISVQMSVDGLAFGPPKQ